VSGGVFAQCIAAVDSFVVLAQVCFAQLMLLSATILGVAAGASKRESGGGGVCPSEGHLVFC
jgi:hypothetical protein